SLGGPRGGSRGLLAGARPVREEAGGGLAGRGCPSLRARSHPAPGRCARSRLLGRGAPSRACLRGSARRRGALRIRAGNGCLALGVPRQAAKRPRFCYHSVPSSRLGGAFSATVVQDVLSLGRPDPPLLFVLLDLLAP